MPALEPILLSGGPNAVLQDMEPTLDEKRQLGDRELVNAIHTTPYQPAKPVANGTNQRIRMAEAHSVPLHNQLAYTPRKARIITVGAGFSGLMMAHEFQHRFLRRKLSCSIRYLKQEATLAERGLSIRIRVFNAMCLRISTLFRSSPIRNVTLLF